MHRIHKDRTNLLKTKKNFSNDSSNNSVKDQLQINKSSNGKPTTKCTKASKFVQNSSFHSTMYWNCSAYKWTQINWSNRIDYQFNTILIDIRSQLAISSSFQIHSLTCNVSRYSITRDNNAHAGDVFHTCNLAQSSRLQCLQMIAILYRHLKNEKRNTKKATQSRFVLLRLIRIRNLILSHSFHFQVQIIPQPLVFSPNQVQ
jgi:hypothetical protein